MSSMLHPVGPEAPQTYWIRRAVVIGAAILALIVVIAIVVSQNSSGSVVAQPTPTAVTTLPATPSTSPYGSTPAASRSATPTVGSSNTASPTASATSTPSASATSSPSPSATSSPTLKATGAVACPARQLRATITGDQNLIPGQPTTMSISLVNGSAAACTVQVTAESFELKVYSGVDRIWSSRDCATAVKPLAKTLAPEQAVGWKMTWDGRRSKDDCQQRPETPQAGTYFATAQYAGAEPVQLRMTLRG